MLDNNVYRLIYYKQGKLLSYSNLLRDWGESK